MWFIVGYMSFSVLSSRTQQQRECEVNAREILERRLVCRPQQIYFLLLLLPQRSYHLSDHTKSMPCTIKSRSATMNDQTIKTPQNIFFFFVSLPSSLISFCHTRSNTVTYEIVKYIHTNKGYSKEKEEQRERTC